MTEPAIIIVILAILLLGSWLLVRYYQRRRALATLAYRLRLRFSAHHDPALPGRLAGLYLMQLGHARRAYHVISGRREDLELIAFDFSYETGLGSDRTSNQASVVVCKTIRVLPSIVALRDNSFQPLGKFSSFTSLATWSPNFDRTFALYADHPEKARRALTDDLQRLLLHCRHVNWELHDGYIVFFADRLLSAPQLRRLIHRALQTAQLLSEPLAKPN
jgi:hypothetical protein